MTDHADSDDQIDRAPAVARRFAAAIAELDRAAGGDGGAPYELWIARANLHALAIADRFVGHDRDAFLTAAAAVGLYEPGVEAAWLLEPTDDLCAHGLPYACCPCGCGDLYDYD